VSIPFLLLVEIQVMAETVRSWMWLRAKSFSSLFLSVG